MLPAWIDHLWQSVLFCALVSVCASLTRASPAIFRLWLWRIAALKFLFPFAWLFALGEWFGFPVEYTVDPAPPSLVAWVDAAAPLLAPAHAAKLPGVFAAWTFVLLAGAVCIRWIIARIGAEVRRTRAERAREEIAPDDALRYPGFFLTLMMSLCAMAIVAAPLVAGAVTDEQRRDVLLIENARSLRTAPIVMTLAAPGMGSRYRVVADEHGVLIRNVNLIELVSIVYGLNRYSVWTDQHVNADAESERNFWPTTPRYDVRATGTVDAPEDFDPYALRQPVTKLLAERFGIAIELNDMCQPPCGWYGVAMSDDPL
jgi:hypothetical protein